MQALKNSLTSLLWLRHGWMLWLPIQMYCIQWKTNDALHFNIYCGQSIQSMLIL